MTLNAPPKTPMSSPISMTLSSRRISSAQCRPERFAVAHLGHQTLPSGSGPTSRASSARVSCAGTSPLPLSGPVSAAARLARSSALSAEYQPWEPLPST